MSRQLGAPDWVKAGLRQLAGQGIDAVRVERLAAVLKVTKGSFYWHFKDLAALRSAMLAEWEQSATSDVIAQLDAMDDDPRLRLHALGRIVFGVEGALERHLRAWATQDEAAAQVQERVDERRVGYVAGLFEAAGFTSAAARERAVFLYHALIGHFALGRRFQLPPRGVDGFIDLLLAHPRAGRALAPRRE